MADLIERLEEHRAWAEANIWEVPIALPDDIGEAIENIEKLKAERDAAIADLKLAKDRVDYLTQWRDAFSEDFLKGYKEQINKEHGIYRCDICINGNDNEYERTCHCSKHECDGYSHWKWRGFKYEPTEEE